MVVKEARHRGVRGGGGGGGQGVGQGQAGRDHRPGWVVVVVGGMVVVMVVVAREWAKGRQGVTIVQGGYQGCGGVWVVVLDFVWTTMTGFWQHELPGLGLFSAIFYDDFPIPVPGVQEAQVSGWKDGRGGGRELTAQREGRGPWLTQECHSAMCVVCRCWRAREADGTTSPTSASGRQARMGKRGRSSVVAVAVVVPSTVL